MTDSSTSDSPSSARGTRPRLALITGATRGIGRAIAECFAAQGFDIFATARNEEDLRQMQKHFSSTYPARTLYTQPADLSDRQSAEGTAASVLQLKRPLDVLVNNAGAFVPDSLLDETDILPQQIATNLYSAYYLTRALLPAFLTQGRGYIFNICSVAGLQAYPGGASYCISKYAMRGFSHVLRKELQPKGIRVSTVLPGATLTDSWKGTSLPPDRFIQAKDIAQLLLSAYDLSDSAVVEELLIRPQEGDL